MKENAIPLSCYLCKHFASYSGDTHWSDDIQRYEVECLKDKWSFNFRDKSAEEIRNFLLTANSCEEFERIEGNLGGDILECGI